MVDKARAQITINGQVQGVFFRLRAQEEAQKLGLTGWVKNNADGSVLALVEGKKDVIAQFIIWCQQGPKQSQVSGTEIAWQPFTGEFKDFNII